MFYGIMWSDAQGIRPVPPPARPGRGGGGPGRGLAAGGALTWARAWAGQGRWRREAGTSRLGRRRRSARLVHPRQSDLDKGGAFLKRRRPLQATAGMAALATTGWGRRPEGVAAPAGLGARVPKVVSLR